MTIRLAVRAALWSMLCVLVVPAGVNAQNASPNFKEVQLADGAFSLGDPVPSWVEPVAIPEAQEAKPIIVRLADTQWLVGDTPVVYVHRAVTVNDAGYLTSAGQLALQFIPQYQRLQLHAIHVLRGGESQDRTKSSTIRFLQRETDLEQGVYSGVVTVSVLVSDLRIGDTIEFSYSTYGQNPVFGGKFVGETSWDQGLPALLRRIVLTSPAAREINWRLIGDAQSKPLTPVETTHEGMRTLRFEERNVPEITAEQYTPADYPLFRVMQFSEFSSWDDVVGWASELFRSDKPIDEEVKKVVDTLRARASVEERVAAALEFVQSEIRYFSVVLGESSHRPAEPNVVLQRRYGDCKDKSVLLIRLLKELGVQSDPVLLRFGRHHGLDKMLPGPQAFDHVIVRAVVGERVFYLDPTRLGQHGRLDRMGQAHEGSEVLIVASGTHELSTISTPNILDLVRNERSETATLPKLEPAGSLETRQTWNGLGAEGLRILYERLPHAQFVKFIGDAMEARYPGARLAAEPKIADDRVNNAFSIVADYDVPKLAADNGGSWVVRFSPENLRGALAVSPSSTRTAPLIVPGFPFDGRYTFEVTFPEQVSVVSDPKSATVQDKQFNYTVSGAFRGNISKTVIDLKTLGDRVETADLRKYTDDLGEVGRLVKGFVFVPKDEIKSNKDLVQILRDREQTRIDKLTETIKSGKLSGDDLASAYCERSSSYNTLEKSDEALRDIEEALALSSSALIIGCRGGIYLNTGEFGKSAADYSKAIVLDPTNSWYYRQRGIARFFLGKPDEAAEDFAKASSTADAGTRSYNDLWLAFTLQRLGKPLPADISKRAEKPLGDWPQPALAMLAGNITPDEMVATLDSKTGDERQLGLAEAYFYAGEHYLVTGDQAHAKEYFEKTRQQGAIIFIEHIAAGHELARLKASGEASQK